MDPSKALVLKPQWARRVLANGKTLELRSRSTNVRGTVAIAASGTGMLLGEVEIYDVVRLARRNPTTGLLEEDHPLGLRNTQEMHQVEDMSILSSYQQVFGWRLRRPKLYNTPQPYVHTPGAIQWVNLRPIPSANAKMKKPAVAKRKNKK